MTRFGFGYDIHRFAPKRKFVLGGVRIPSKLGLLGHSDADVLLHAICDALLGAAAMGDIGQHFPNNDHQFKGISGLTLLGRVRDLLEESRFRIINVDSTVILQTPKIAPYISRMQKRIATKLRIKVNQVSVKATTNEGLGALGHGEGCAAYAVAAIQPSDER